MHRLLKNTFPEADRFADRFSYCFGGTLRSTLVRADLGSQSISANCSILLGAVVFAGLGPLVYNLVGVLLIAVRYFNHSHAIAVDLPSDRYRQAISRDHCCC